MKEGPSGNDKSGYFLRKKRRNKKDAEAHTHRKNRRIPPPAPAAPAPPAKPSDASGPKPPHAFQQFFKNRPKPSE